MVFHLKHYWNHKQLHSTWPPNDTLHCQPLWWNTQFTRPRRDNIFQQPRLNPWGEFYFSERIFSRFSFGEDFTVVWREASAVNSQFMQISFPAHCLAFIALSKIYTSLPIYSIPFKGKMIYMLLRAPRRNKYRYVHYNLLNKYIPT